MKQQALKYAIVDIETTGGLSRRDKITEVAIVVYDGQQIIDQFSSLINPERSIPFEITRITGINNQMVAEAPKFFEVAKKIVEITEDCIFVAHNVMFDYSFLREEFGNLGYNFVKKTLCTVKLSRKTFPGLTSYSLGNLIRHFGIQVTARHRALDDALATTEIFGKIVAISKDNQNIGNLVKYGLNITKMPDNIDKAFIEKLPDTTGIYYFHDQYSRIIYVGKSIHIRTRVMQHFAEASQKSEKILRLTKDITYMETGSELVSLLLESEEIKTHMPEINKAQRKKEFPFCIFQWVDDEGYINLSFAKSNAKLPFQAQILSYYHSAIAAKNALGNVRERLELCEEKIRDPHDKNKRCIYYAMQSCRGACQGIENAEDYNVRAAIAQQDLNKLFDANFFVVTQGRNDDESGIILVEDSFYQGFGFIAKEDTKYGVEELKECIAYKTKNVDANIILQQYLKSHKDYEVIYF